MKKGDSPRHRPKKKAMQYILYLLRILFYTTIAFIALGIAWLCYVVYLVRGMSEDNDGNEKGQSV